MVGNRGPVVEGHHPITSCFTNLPTVTPYNPSFPQSSGPAQTTYQFVSCTGYRRQSRSHRLHRRQAWPPTRRALCGVCSVHFRCAPSLSRAHFRHGVQTTLIFSRPSEARTDSCRATTPGGGGGGPCCGPTSCGKIEHAPQAWALAQAEVAAPSSLGTFLVYFSRTKLVWFAPYPQMAESARHGCALICKALTQDPGQGFCHCLDHETMRP